MLDDLNDDVSEVGTETGEENDLELTPEEVDAAYGLEENGVEGGAPPGDTREESEKAESTSLETDKGVDNSGGMDLARVHIVMPCIPFWGVAVPDLFQLFPAEPGSQFRVCLHGFL